MAAASDVEKFRFERFLEQSQPISARSRPWTSKALIQGFPVRSFEYDNQECIAAEAVIRREGSNQSIVPTGIEFSHLFESVFALGQMQDAEAILALASAVKDMSLHLIVWHECMYEAEGMRDMQHFSPSEIVVEKNLFQPLLIPWIPMVPF
ncbi:PREDICTED: deoxyhypusine hydroxylase [Tarenaya hassleriana]|uniref:deoxyhypusine hydroxylase n=1 Tax=Tarenaya hassleriana TaxID=28532 RepID=UPI00053C70BF|nr:PREDICTED: deoxyhypusine hydroxylase [Tarenaya hassleriana]